MTKRGIHEERLPDANLHKLPSSSRLSRESEADEIKRLRTRIRAVLRASNSYEEKSKTSEPATSENDPASYSQPFIDFINGNPTVYHAVSSVAERLASKGFTKLAEREAWNEKLEKGGKYFLERNGSSVVAFVIGSDYEPGNGASIIATHIDALTTRLKPISVLPPKDGYVQLGVAPYAGALNGTWWDRDLGIGGRVLVKDPKSGKIETKLVKLDWPIARIPTLAPHFGLASNYDHANKETEMVPIIGLDSTSTSTSATTSNHCDKTPSKSSNSNIMPFHTTQAPRLVHHISKTLSICPTQIQNWDLELFDTQPACLGGLDREFIFAGRIDDKLCSFSAIEALLASSDTSPNTLRVVACFDDEEIGSLLRQGAHSNLLPSTLSRITSSLCSKSSTSYSPDILSQLYANSFLISADVSHAFNPNFPSSYLANHSPKLNTGLAVQGDSNGHTTTDGASTAFLQRVAEKSNSELQVFQIRNDSRSGGTVGPMLSSAMGMRAIDAGSPQLSMHSIRATTGRDDPGLGVRLFRGFFEHFEEIDGEFR